MLKKMSSFAMSSIIILATGLLTGCQETKIEYSKTFTETAVVLDLVYTPSRHGSDIAPTIGLTGEGDMSFGITPISIDIPEVYAIVFKCEHGKFIINCDTPERLKIWQKLEEKQKVVVMYREKYRTIYEDGRIISRSLEKYDFLDAR